MRSGRYVGLSRFARGRTVRRIRRGRGLRGYAHDKGRISAITTIENPAQFLAAPQKGIGFVDQERGPHVLNGAEERWRTDVSRRKWPADQFIEHAQERGFSAWFLRR